MYNQPIYTQPIIQPNYGNTYQPAMQPMMMQPMTMQPMMMQPPLQPTMQMQPMMQPVYHQPVYTQPIYGQPATHLGITNPQAYSPHQLYNQPQTPQVITINGGNKSSKNNSFCKFCK